MRVQLIRIGLIATICGSPVIASGADWPTAKPAPVVKSEPKSKPKSAAPVAIIAKDSDVRLKPDTTVKPVVRPIAEAAIPTAANNGSDLKALTELVARQTAAIDALTRRLESAELSAKTMAVVDVTPQLAAVSAAPAAPAAAPMAALQVAPRPVPITPRVTLPVGYKRWVDVQQTNVQLRYRYIDNSAGVRTNDQGQSNVGIKARVRLDNAAHYSVNVGVFSGAGITSGWNNAGWGTGDRQDKQFLKQLYFSAAPVNGLEFQYGSLYAVRGEATEITHFDNDFYLSGERVTVKRPKDLWLDEITATQAYVGDNTLPNVFDRYKRLTDPNYFQVLLGKKFGTHVAASTEYAETAGIGLWHNALAVKAPAMTVIDGVRFESYERPVVGPNAFGWAFTAERSLPRKAAVSGGFANIDEHFGGLNGDRYNKGERWFANASFPIHPALTVAAFYTQALDAEYAIANQERFDVLLTYNVLKTRAQTPR